MIRWSLVPVLLLFPSLIPASESPTYLSTIAVASFDNFILNAVVDLPAGTTEKDVEKVVILLHGSGPQSMDEDFSAASTPGTDNRWFVDIGAALNDAGFGVVRYNKRSYEAGRQLKSDEAFVKSKTFKDYAANPLKYFVEDAAHFVKWTRNRMPQARVFLLGHSQGSYIALQVARQEKAVAGLALIGFTLQSLDTALYEQYVYRPLGDFVGLDRNRDGRLDSREMRGEGRLRENLRAQTGLLDIDGNGTVDRTEFIAGNLSNLIRDLPSQGAMRLQEALYPRVGAILQDLDIPVAFFQGEWDNQTRSFNAKAVEIMNRGVWRKDNLFFYYFPRLGHALDERSNLNDLTYRKIDPKALATMTAKLRLHWR